MIPLSILHRILLDLPRPLGFARVFGPAEDAAEKMIRAELNVKITAKIRDSQRQHWYKKVASKLVRVLLGGLEQNENRFKSTSFEDFMVTLVNWRKPSKVPPMLKLMRIKMMPEVLAMTQALIMRDFLWRIGPSKHRQNDVCRKIRQRRTFFRWTITDRHFARYRMHKIELKEEADEKSVRNPIYRGIEHTHAVTASNVLLTPLEEPPTTIITVPEAIRDYQRHRIQKPSLGIESFLEMVHGHTVKVERQHYVVCRFVDDRSLAHKKLGNIIFLADFSNVEWDKWDTFEKEHDEFFQPRTKGYRIDEAPPAWCSVDIKLNTARTQILLRKRVAMTKEQNRLRQRAALLGATTTDIDYDQEFAVFNPRELSGIGTLRSIQSFLVEAPHFEGGFATQIRLILGTHPLDPVDLRVKALRNVGLQKCEDAVVEVLGYIPKGAHSKDVEEIWGEEPKDNQVVLDNMARDIESEHWHDESAATSVKISDSESEEEENAKS
eukprot:CAMPEP_0179442356 /NCGR_PEP_ID=MMETSP0799-20121207/25872_1 /TAXON_ID=46947 /ORGANISM="Geminigera cryophila, Strain CCMP2564" /LENGTH=493 /DNA_ID=CAMNT_0021227457 /DNA_START=364 /DNA_END=1845 /DNA_ORIENTATION=+